MCFFLFWTAALIFYLPGVCTHTLTLRENRVRNILKSSGKTQYLMNTLYLKLLKNRIAINPCPISCFMSWSGKEYGTAYFVKLPLLKVSILIFVCIYNILNKPNHHRNKHPPLPYPHSPHQVKLQLGKTQHFGWVGEFLSSQKWITSD